jgi:hypothetical protein
MSSVLDLPSLPVETFLIVPLAFIFIVLFTNVRYQLRPLRHISSISIFASLVIGFIFLYGMQKFDKMDANVPVVQRNIIFLSEIAQKYDPSLICILIQYVVDFLNFRNDTFPIIRFEEKLVPLLSTQEEIFRVREAVTILEMISNERITGTNLIAEPIWYLVFVSVFILTVIFPLDTSFEKPMDSVLAIILLWFPLFIIYFLYNSELDRLQRTMKCLIEDLQRINKKNGVKCEKTYSYY